MTTAKELKIILRNKLKEHKAQLTKPNLKKYELAILRPNTQKAQLQTMINQLMGIEQVMTSSLSAYKLLKVGIDDNKIINKVLSFRAIPFNSFKEGLIQVKRIYSQLKPDDDVVLVCHVSERVKKRSLLISSSVDFPKSGISYHHLNNLKGFKSRFDYYYYQAFGHDLNGKGNLYIYPQNLRPKKFMHFLKDGPYNCVLKQIKEYYKDNDKKIKMIDALNNKYYNDGITFEDLDKIATSLRISIKIKNKCGDMIYQNINGHEKIFEYNLIHNNHVEEFKNIFGDMKKKNIVYIDDINDEMEKNKDKIIIYKRDCNNEINYFFDAETLYKKKELKEIDNGSHYINSTYDLYRNEFENDNNLTENYITDDNKVLFDFVNNSCHHVNEIFFTENNLKQINYMSQLDISISHLDDNITDDEINDIKEISKNEKYIDLSGYYCYDKNKAYCNYINLKSYNVAQFPACGKFSLYKCDNLTDDELKHILYNKVGFLQIDNIIYNNISINKINYFINGYIYPINVLLWAYENNIIKYDVKTLCINNFKQKINMSSEFIENKIYNKLFGSYVIKSNKKTLNIKYNNVDELQDLMFYSSKIRRYTDKELFLEFDLACMSNKAHISSYIYGYNMITIMDKLKQINFNDIVGIKVDCIILKKRYDIFNLSTDFKDWKIEKKDIKEIYEHYVFINSKDIFNNKDLYNSSHHKIYYEKINYIMGGAGVGKTSRFYKKFDNTDDERLSSMAFGFPNNNLRCSFEDTGNIKKYTYHTALNICVSNPLNRVNYLKNICDLVIDEATMVSHVDYVKILKEAEKEKINIFFVGDFNLKNKKLYQLEPATDESFIYKAIKGYEIYLTQNYRQNGDNKFLKYLESIRGKNHEEILNL